MIDVITGLLWITGSLFAFLAAFGVVRMPDVFTRMQASTKASTACTGGGGSSGRTSIWVARLRSIVSVFLAALVFTLPRPAIGPTTTCPREV